MVWIFVLGKDEIANGLQSHERADGGFLLRVTLLCRCSSYACFRRPFLLLPPPPPPTLLPPFRLLYLWLCPLRWKRLSSGPVDLEIEYSLRSARDNPCSWGSHPAKGAGGNEFQSVMSRSLLATFSTFTLETVALGSKDNTCFRSIGTALPWAVLSILSTGFYLNLNL